MGKSKRVDRERELVAKIVGRGGAWLARTIRSNLWTEFGVEVSGPSLTRHLAALREEGVVRRTRGEGEARWIADHVSE